MNEVKENLFEELSEKSTTARLGKSRVSKKHGSSNIPPESNLVEINLNKGMTWKEFRKLPHDLQQKYINHITDNYEVSLSLLGKMFGVNSSTISEYFKRNGIKYKYANKKASRFISSDEKNRFVSKYCPVYKEPTPIADNYVPDFSKPISWSVFKAMKKADQQEYINYLSYKYKVNCVILAEIMGVKYKTLLAYFDIHGLRCAFKYVNHTKEEAQKIIDYRNGNDTVDKSIEENTIIDTEEDEGEVCELWASKDDIYRNKNELDQKLKEGNTPTSTVTNTLNSIKLKFKGEFNIEEIVDTLVSLNIKGDKEITIKITTPSK